MGKDKIKVLENIDVSVKSSKTIALICVFGFIILSVLIFSLYTNALTKSIDRVYVVTELGTQRVTDERSMVRGHVGNFYKLFFAIDQYNYKRNVNKALNLIGESGKKLLADYKNAGWFQSLVNNNIIIDVQVDSVLISNTKSPYIVNAFGLMYIRSGNATVVKKLNSRMTVDKVANSDNNPYGLLINDFILTDNSVIKNPDDGY